MKLRRALAGAALGAAPGIVMVLLAQFVIKGEMQLSIGAPGIVIAVLGLLLGFLFGWNRQVG